MGKSRSELRQRRQRRVRGKVSGTATRPRLSVYRSLMNVYAQLIDDDQGHTLASASTIDPEVAKQITGLNGVAKAKVVGKALAERAKQAGIETVVFDRGGYRYHGQVKALADASREAGLQF
jgi:large subunit ribosomal protein L18